MPYSAEDEAKGMGTEWTPLADQIAALRKERDAALADVERLKALVATCERFRTKDAQSHIEETADLRHKVAYYEQMAKIHKWNSDKYSKALDTEREARYDLGPDPEPG